MDIEPTMQVNYAVTLQAQNKQRKVHPEKFPSYTQLSEQFRIFKTSI